MGVAPLEAKAQTTPVINEIMARNDLAAVDPYGDASDWLELYNPGTVDADMGGWQLGLSGSSASSWTIPTGIRIPANGYLVIWCNGNRPASTVQEEALNMGQSLSAAGGQILLKNAAGTQVDSVVYGMQIADLSIGRVNGAVGLLDHPTPGAANAALMSLGDPVRLRINEWLANPSSGGDWFELFNGDAKPVALAGCHLSNETDPASTNKFSIRPLSYIPAQGWVLYNADKDTNAGPDHVSFGLSAKGGSIVLWSSNLVLLDRVDFGAQTSGISEGRLPDGTTNIVKFPTTATPGEDNYLPLTQIVINEVLTHTDPPLEDAVELYNPNALDVDVGGWFLSNSGNNLKRYRIPDGTKVVANGYLVLYEYQFIGIDRFTFNSAHGDSVYLSSGDAVGNLTGYRVKQSFGAAFNGVSFGRHITSDGVDFVAMKSRTFGQDSPTSLDVFRTGKGMTNSAPRVGPVVINEIMYHPRSLDTNGTDNLVDEYVEIHNFSAIPIPLYDPNALTNRWKVGGDISYTFAPYSVLPAGGMMILVGFNPSSDLEILAGFKQRYGLGNTVMIQGPWSGKLSNASGKVELYQPDNPQLPPHPDAGFVPYVLVDKVKYSDAFPWPAEADGGGSSLQRRSPVVYGNDPVNWGAAAPTPLSPNADPQIDTDMDGMPDAWEIANGLLPTDPADAEMDADGDGQTNRAEYWCGTDPRDSKSVLKIASISRSAGMVIIRFKALAGKSYRIESAVSLRGAAWQVLTNIPATDSNHTVEITNPLGANGGSQFFRLLKP